MQQWAGKNTVKRPQGLLVKTMMMVQTMTEDKANHQIRVISD